ncbi:MAG TPA: cyclic nucleotide-binding domain-containing protein [Clostridiales bacterium]|mgnify:CR=1 FL=1|nr:cyclic nucleotide-binding domain-containing protein [Clostridiales bacterium]HQP69129.1 cyclic nucleotide-binding domain-containing protein [Clostridiales bacterium]
MSAVSQNSLFFGLNSEQTEYVISLMDEKFFKSGEVIIPENSTGNTMYLLKKGDISIEKELIPLIEGFKPGPDDKKIIRLNDSQNIFFGEMSLFDPTLKRTATIKALSDTEVLILRADDFEKILSERKDIGVIILKNIALKLSRTLETSNIELSKMITAFTLSLKL